MTDLTPVQSDGTAEAAVVAVLASKATKPHELRPGRLFAHPEAQHLIDLERYNVRPHRRKGLVIALDAASFARLVTDLGPDDGRSAIYADIETPNVTAVLNDHDAEAGWGDHRVVLPVVRTRQWQRWLARDGRIGDQVEFAQHIEDNLADIASPPGADLLELAQTFEAATSAEFTSGARLHDGSRQLRWVEKVEARAGQQGQINVPEKFTLVISPFEGSDQISVTARLRYRVRNGQLAIGYQLHQPEDVERAAFNSVVVVIGAATGIEPYLAKAPAVR